MTVPDPNAIARQIASPKLPPVEQWQPPLSGEMDLRITRDGRWWHEGTLMQRESLVRLFASILRRDDDGCYYLVTPVEKWRIQVEDVPFLAVLLTIQGQGAEQMLTFSTNLGEQVVAGPEHSLHVDEREDGEPAPYVHLRGGLWCRLSRAVFLQLAEVALAGEHHGENTYGVWSHGCFFRLGPRTD